jgi:signal transduction histidine kinase
MATLGHSDGLRAALAAVDPRRSFGAAAMWLIVALAVTFAVAAAVWVGGIARRNVLEQHVRRLSLETDQLSSDLGQALTVRLDAVHAAGAMAKASGERPDNLRIVFAELTAAYPNLDWIDAADAHGVIVASRDSRDVGTPVTASPWFSSGTRGPWLGVVDLDGRPPFTPSNGFADFGDLAIPVGAESTPGAGVIRAHVRWRRAAHHPERLTDEPDPRTTTEVCVMDQAGMILVGPTQWLGKRWPGVPVASDPQAGESGPAAPGSDAPRFERLPDGRRALVATSALAASDEITSLGWRVLLIEPNERVFQRANALALQILWVSLCLGVVTAGLGILGAQQLTRRLKQLAVSVTQVGQHATSRIEVPGGADEVARLGQAFARLLDELALERNELERRVAVRSREVERLAEESRYAAIVRERLTIARDLHDTLAHSMMAILSEIRFLRKLQSRDPHALTKELARAELIAHEGLQEARRAITQVRATAVRETGLGPALEEVFERFLNLTGLTGDFQADVSAAPFGDERAETVLRMAREALRNVERHAKATHVIMRLQAIDESSLELRIEDNGVGFDPETVPPGHYGLVGLREQAEIIDAELDIQSVPNQGTTFRVVLRLSPVVFKPMGGVQIVARRPT